MRSTLTVMKKELAETLRDPLVLVMSVGFPLLFFPLVMWATVQLLMLEEGISDAAYPRIEIVGVDAPGPGGLVDALTSEPAIRTEGDNAAITAGELDLLVTVELDATAVTVKMSHDSTRARSTGALSWAKEQLEAVRTARIAELAAASGTTPDALEPWSYEVENIRDEADQIRDGTVLILPAMVFINLLLAVMAPAVDVFVGERERGTLETTLTSSVSRWSVLAGKTLAVMVIALVAAMGNFIAMGLTVAQMIASMSEEAIAAPSYEWVQLLMVFPTLIAFTALIVALNFIVVLPASTFKQAQNMSTIVLVLGMASVMGQINPDATAPPWLVWVPAANVIPCMSMAMRGSLSVVAATAGLLTNGGLAAVLLAFVARRMHDESYLFSEAGPSRWIRWIPGWSSTEGSAR